MSSQQNQTYLAQLERKNTHMASEWASIREQNLELERSNLSFRQKNEALLNENFDLRIRNRYLQERLQFHEDNAAPSENPPKDQERNINIIQIQEQQIALKDGQLRETEERFNAFFNQVGDIFRQEDAYMEDLTREVLALREEKERYWAERNALMEGVNARDTLILRKENEINNLRKSLLQLAQRKRA